MSYKNISLTIISVLILLSIYCAISIGVSWDEPFHHTQGALRMEYIKTFGKFKNYNFSSSTQFYPGLYDTISFITLKFLLNIFPNKYFVEIKHLINLFFSLLALLGLFMFAKKIFNKESAYLAVIICFINPFFFGHMAMNPKDTIVCFSLIWFVFFLYLYCVNIEKKNYKFLLLSSIAMGFGLGVRVSFIAITIPILFATLIFIFKNKNKIKNFYKKIFLDLISFISVSFFLMIIAWPHVIEGNLNLIIETIINSIKYNAGAKLGLINGEFYETSNTPRFYLANFFLFRIPIFSLILFFVFFYIFFFDKNFFKEKFPNFNIKLILIFSCLIFPILIALVMKVKIYDGIRLFLFLIPILSLICALSLYYLFENFKKNRVLKYCFFSVIIFLSLFLFRFIVLTPYQYDFSNYFNINFEKTKNNYEHDYWGVSFKELIYKISKEKKTNNFINNKISLCGGDPWAVKYYLNKYIGKIKFVHPNDADYILMTNRASFNVNDKSTCYNKYNGEDIITVERLNLSFSKLIKIIK